MRTAEVRAGDLVLIPARVVRVGEGRVRYETEEPPEGEPWPVLVVNAGQRGEVKLATVAEPISLGRAAA